MMLRGLLLSVLLSGTALVARAQPAIIGYVEKDRFYPLLVVDAAQFGPYDARTMNLAGAIARDAFAAGGAEFPIQAEREATDPLGEPTRYGVVPGRSDPTAFFELNRGAKPRPSAPPPAELEQSLRRFLIDDERSAELRIVYAP